MLRDAIELDESLMFLPNVCRHLDVQGYLSTLTPVGPQLPASELSSVISSFYTPFKIGLVNSPKDSLWPDYIILQS